MSASVDINAPRFADAFWDDNHYGVDAIDERLLNAKQTCEEIRKLYEIRSQMEGDYGDRLLKLSQLIVGQDEDGTLAESLSHIPSALETTARAHMDLAQQLQHHLQSPLDNFMKEQSDLYSGKQRHIQDIIQKRKSCYESMMKAKGAYTSECVKLGEIYRFLEEFTVSADDRAQAENDRDACLKNIEEAEREYRQAIDTYNDSTMTWVDEWRATCDTYQQLEEKRIRFVRSSLWAFANMMSSVYIVDDQCCERIRTALELTDIDKDIYAFVEKHGTGRLLPGFAEFENALPQISSMHASSSGTRALDSEPEHHHQQDHFEIKALPTVPPVMTDQQNKTSNEVQQEGGPSEAMAFAMRAVENMLQDDQEKHNDRDDAAVSLSEHILPAQQLPAQEIHTMHDAKPPRTPQPSVLDTTKPSSLKSTESGQLRFKPVPNPAFARTSESPQQQQEQQQGQLSTTATSDVSKLKRQSQYEHKEDDNDEQLAELISTAALVASATNGNDHATVIKETSNDDVTALTNVIVNANDNDNGQASKNNETIKMDDPTQLTDDESEEDYEVPVRTPPKDEKWVISSIRRPQMVPVRSANARLYDGKSTPRSSMVRSSMVGAESNEQISPTNPDDDQSTPQQYDEPSAETNVNAKMTRPHPPLKIEIPNKNETKAAAQEAIAAARAHTQQQSQPSQQQSQSQANDTVGIRPPPWQQEGSSLNQPQQQQQHSSYNHYDTSGYNQRFSQQPQQGMYGNQHARQTSGGLQRYGSVSGPRPDIIASGADNDNVGRSSKNGKEFSKFMKGVLKSNDGRPLSSDTAGMQEPHSTSSKKDKGGGRFSLGIFGNKKDKEKRQNKEGRESVIQQQRNPPTDMLISGPPGGGPIIMDNNVNVTNAYYNNSNTNHKNTATMSSNHNSYNGTNSNGALRTTSSISSGVMAHTQQVKESSSSIPSASSLLQQQQQQQQQYPINDGPSSIPQQHKQSANPSSAPAYGYSEDMKHLSDGTPIMHYARAVWSFTASIPLEMSFSAGDRLAIVKKQADGWWDAELQGPKKSRGLVPGNYMEVE